MKQVKAVKMKSSVLKAKPPKAKAAKEKNPMTKTSIGFGSAPDRARKSTYPTVKLSSILKAGKGF